MCFQFAVFLLVILITEIAIGVVAFVNKDGWNSAINDSISETFGNYDKSEEINNDINNLQRTVSHTEEIQIDSHFCNNVLPQVCVQKCYDVIFVEPSTII
jgi:hypothetical protein